ncbi:MAG: sulfite exporter TauE/SafE family protein [Pseudanabaenaceae cyanobacterium]
MMETWGQGGVLALAGFAAGTVDAIAGGGGLIQFPALWLALSSQPLPVLLGTNKLASIAGTSMAVGQYVHKVGIPRPIWWGAIAAGLGSYSGARLTDWLPVALLRPLVLILLLAVWLFTALRPRFGLTPNPKSLSPLRQVWGVGAIALTLGFYDGFFGPGTGTFLTFALIGFLGFDFLQATAAAKLLNWATNLGALLHFGPNHQILYFVALPLALCNLGGGWVGARWAIARGAAWVRALFLTVAGALWLRLAWDLWTRFGSGQPN